MLNNYHSHLWQEVKFQSYGQVWGDLYREWLKCIHEKGTCKETVRP